MRPSYAPRPLRLKLLDMSVLLHADSLTKSYGTRLLFRDISISFADEDRTGLFGPNGAGKSTLMRILAGLEPPDSGTLVTRRNLRLAYVPQSDEFPAGKTVEEIMLASVSGLHLDENEQYTRIGVLMDKVGFDRLDQPVEALSGGWRKRLTIARALAGEPDLMLLDEPTNHLDVEGVIWLEKLLEGGSFAYIVVTHDRYFLERVTNRVVELNRAFPQGYLSINDTYSGFLEKRSDFLTAQQAQEQAISSRLRREVEWLRRGAKARTTKAKGRIDAAGRMMEELAELKNRNAATRAAAIDFVGTERKSKKLLVTRGVSKSLGGRKLFEGVDLFLSPGSKLGLLGPNGSGKTTLLRVLAGELEPDAGTIQRAEGLRIVRFSQSREQLDPTVTLREALAPGSDVVRYRDSTLHVTAWARQFLFRAEQMNLPVGELSGGEQARALIARLMLRPADLLILDEPTNDLDIPTLEVLEESLEEFPGALVLVTHDRFMLDRLATELLALDGQGNAGLYAELSQWESARAGPGGSVAASAPTSSNKKDAKPAARSGNQQNVLPSATRPRLTSAERREWQEIEDRIAQAEAEVQTHEAQVNDPQIMADRRQLTAACEKLTAAQNRVKQLYDRWQELEDKAAPS